METPFSDFSRLGEEFRRCRKPVVVVGSGIFGSVMAERLASDGGRDVFVL